MPQSDPSYPPGEHLHGVAVLPVEVWDLKWSKDNMERS